jgi:hypothetical protein
MWKVTRSVEIPRRSHSARIRSRSASMGVTASCSVPAAAKTSVLAPAPVSNVAWPACSSHSSQASAGQWSPQNSPAPCSCGGAALSSSVSDLAMCPT